MHVSGAFRRHPLIPSVHSGQALPFSRKGGPQGEKGLLGQAPAGKVRACPEPAEGMGGRSEKRYQAPWCEAVGWKD